MKMQSQLASVMLLAATPFLSGVVAADDTYCWRDAYARGLGVHPDECPDGRTRIGPFCYSECPEGFDRWGFDCHQVCPDGLRNDGLFCRLAEYKRRGFSWKFKDGLSSDGMFKRCENNHGEGNCEQCLATVFPMCEDGFEAALCKWCRPAAPDCEALGMAWQLDLSCAKKIILGDPTPLQCDEDLDRDTGLCYNNCEEGFEGLGPVCFDGPPDSWIQCGFAAAVNVVACAVVSTQQLTSVIQVVMFLATFGTASGVIILGNDAVLFLKVLAEIAKVAQLLPGIIAANPAFGGAVDDYMQTQDMDINDLLNMGDLDNPADVVRMIATLVTIFDPTGISSVVAAFTYPVCSNLNL